MKNLLACLCIILLFNSCDDGDLSVVSFQFVPENVKACKGAGTGSRFFLYNIKDSRAFILKIPEETFKNEIVSEAIPIEINSSISLIYREYNGSLASETICSDIPASNPVVTKEHIATGGKIYITTSAVRTTDQATGATRVTGYNHSIIIKDVTFNVDGGTQKNEEINFGIYNEPETTFNVLSNTSVATFSKCPGTNNYYIINGAQAVTLTADPSLFNNTPGVKPIALINGTTTALKLQLYNNNLISSSFCTGPTPIETWTANNGNATSGQIEVTTTTNASNFTHTIRLKNVTLTKANVSFNLGTYFLLGTYTSN
ncbi:MAG TPA: hypothetical protein VF677_13635 [Flavobacterium sp.]